MNGGANAAAQPRLARLEMLRGLAAVYVVFYHLTNDLTQPWGLLGLPFRLGQEAVMLFFLLSGFVIYRSTAQRHPTFGEYLRHRLARIYPIFLLALLISGICYFLTHRAAPAWWPLMGNLCMWQDLEFVKPGPCVPPFANNSPLWTLSYEWWSYLIFFAVWRWVPPPARWWAAVSVSSAGLCTYLWAPNQASLFALYFITWYAGAALAEEYTRRGTVTWRGQASMLISFGLFTIVAISACYCSALPKQPGIGFFPLVFIRHLGIPVLLCLVAIGWAQWRWRGFDLTFRWFKPAAAVSYALYAFHYPICMYGIAQRPLWWRAVTALGLLLPVALLAELWWQPKAQRLFFREVERGRTSTATS